MKSLLLICLCLALISMVMTSPEVVSADFLKLSECQHPIPPPHCLAGNRGFIPVPANPYDRGCSAASRCRGGG